MTSIDHSHDYYTEIKNIYELLYKSHFIGLFIDYLKVHFSIKEDKKAHFTIAQTQYLYSKLKMFNNSDFELFYYIFHRLFHNKECLHSLVNEVGMVCDTRC